MNSSQSTFLSGAIFGIAVGLVCGHFTIWRHAGRPDSDPQTSFQLTEGPYFQQGPDFDLGERSASLPPEYFSILDEATEPEGNEDSPFENAIAFETTEGAATEEVVTPKKTAELDVAVKQIPLDAQAAEEPQPLSVPEATSLKEHTARSEDEIRALIDRELPGAPQSQKDVWFDSLKDLKTDDVTGVLKMWKMFGGPSASMSVLDEIESPQNNAATTITGDQLQLIQQAIAWHQHNLLMASTPGYMRIVPTFVETETPEGVTITKLEKRRSFERGRRMLTNHPFDISMKVAGFFELKSPTGEVVYTKRGDFCLNEDHKLSLMVNGTEYIVQPEQTVPCPEPEEAEAPYLYLYKSFQVSIINHSDLIDCGNGLFKVREGGVVLDAFDTAEQGELEAANVNPEDEHAAIKRLQSLLKAGAF